jgi:hypothetical protein
MNFKHLILLFGAALFFTVSFSASGWAPLGGIALVLDAIVLGYGIGLKWKLIRAGKFYEQEESEFGAGLVVCLAKFSEHLEGERPRALALFAQWIKDGQPTPMPQECRSMDIALKVRGTVEAALSSEIEMWMNAASDHFYDLDRERAPESLLELADLTLEIGHGFTGKMWDETHLTRIRELWKHSCLELDRKLKTKPDWGTW